MLGPDILLSTILASAPCPCFPLNVRNQVSHNFLWHHVSYMHSWCKTSYVSSCMYSFYYMLHAIWLCKEDIFFRKLHLHIVLWEYIRKVIRQPEHMAKQRQSYVTTDGQLVNMPWCRAYPGTCEQILLPVATHDFWNREYASSFPKIALPVNIFCKHITEAM
jgi:hypothetical protein